jgi:hypothetical protein
VQGTTETYGPRVGGDPWAGRQDPRWANDPRWADAGPPVPAVDYAGRPGQYQDDYYARPDYPGGPGQQRADYPDWRDYPAGPGQQQPAYPEWHGQQQPGYAGQPVQRQPGYPGQPVQRQTGYPEWHGQQQPAYPGWQGQRQVDYQGDFGQYALHPDHPSWPESQFPPWPDGGAQVSEYLQAPVAVVDWAQPDVSYTQPDVRYAQPAREQIWDAGSSQLSDWIIADANEQAAEITREARGQAATSLADAHNEAAELLRRTGEQAALTLEAAERQAAEIRATVMRLSTELTGMATYVTQSLTSPQQASASPAFAPPAPAAPTSPSPTSPSPATRQFAQPTVWPVSQPAAEPATAPSVQPAASPRVRPAATPGGKPARRPAAEPAATPTVRPAAKPNAKSRQVVAVRVMTVFTAAMVVFALTAGASEVALHGFKFFVFRAAGTGETSGSGLQEDQGPGQPDAPGAHQQLHTP